MGFSRYFKSDAVKIVGGVAAGYALSRYAPQIQTAATSVRKKVQSVRKSVFRGSDSNPLKTSAAGLSLSSLFGGATKQQSDRIASDAARGSLPAGSQGGFWESIKDFLRRLLA